MEIHVENINIESYRYLSQVSYSLSKVVSSQ